MIHRRLIYILQAILVFYVVVAASNQQWLAMMTTIGIVIITLGPFLLGRFFRVSIPPEFVMLAVVFIFASLFLGEIRGYYTRFWWWDIVLHAGSGFLLGILGFLLVHVLNETEHIELHMKPGFVAFFAFVFSVAMGAIWEIFEFSMDGFFGMNMQKEMLNDPSGHTDTMWDLIVDAIGALIIAVLGYGFIKNTRDESFLERWIQTFIKNNPRFFNRRQ